MIQKPAINSLDSVKGPSVTTRLPLDTRIRVPLELGWSPSAVSSTPAFAISWLNFLIAVTISAGGIAQSSSACAGAGSNIMNRIVVSPFWFRVGLRASGRSGPAKSTLYLRVERGLRKSTGTLSFFKLFVKGSRTMSSLGRSPYKDLPTMLVSDGAKQRPYGCQKLQ